MWRSLGYRSRDTMASRCGEEHVLEHHAQDEQYDAGAEEQGKPTPRLGGAENQCRGYGGRCEDQGEGGWEHDEGAVGERNRRVSP